MLSTRNKVRTISVLVILSLIFSFANVSPATAGGGAYAQPGSDGAKRQFNALTGKVSFIGPESGRVLAASQALGTLLRPNDPAMALAKRFGPEFGLKDAERDLTELRLNRPGDGRVTVRYQQNYQGIPVMGGELIVNTNENGDLYSMNGEISSDISLLTQPTVDSEQARESALQAVAKWYQKTPADFLASEPELWIFDEGLLRSSNRPAELVWRMEVTSVDNSMPIRELALINAQRGNLSLHFNQIDTAWPSSGSSSPFNHVPNSNKPGADTAMFENRALLTFSPLVNTYTANNTTSLPGAFLCNQSQPNCTNGSNPHADAAHKYAIGTFNLYDTQHNRNSINNSGMAIISTVHFYSGYANAFWNGAQMVYGDGYGFPLADDVVAHELTHGVTQYESSLFYYYQSGAINESFSDLWGEYYDQTNGQGNDAAGVKWQMGEDISGLGAIRSMSNPPAFGHPDMMSSANYFEGEEDNGGVHTNSGLNNKAVFLMVDGGAFNGKTVTALGWVKTAAIYYEAQTNLLTSGADYSDLYYALQQACANLIGQKGITAGNCVEVTDAVDAVEMNSQPAPGFNTDAPLCSAAGEVPYITFADDLETGTANWTFTNGAYTRWQYDSPYGQYAQSGNHFLYADDYPETITDASARLTSFVVPINSYLHFAHAYDFDAYLPPPGPYYFDGGVLEYSANGGSSWLDAGSLMEVNGYDDTISSGSGNPLAGRSAFVGASHGYISTRLNLASLAGQTVTFRWRMGLDGSVYSWGWWVDNIKVYRCGAPNLDVSIGGTLMDSYYVPVSNSLRQSYAGVDSGPVKVQSTNAVPIVAGLRELWVQGGLATSSFQMMGLPASQLSDTYWFPSYNNVTLNEQVRFGNVGASNTTVTVTIGGVIRGTYPLTPNQQVRVNYAGLDSGPVKVQSSGGVNIIAAIRDAWMQGTAVESFSQLMGLPATQLSDTYWFPSYNNVTLNEQLRFGNVGIADTNVTVTIGATSYGPYLLHPNEQFRINYPGVDGGPVKVQSTGGVKIIAAIREAWSQNGSVQSWIQLMGLPGPQLSDTYYLPAYDNVTLNGQLRFGNVGASNTTVTVTIGGVIRGTYPLIPNQQVRVNYVGVNSGPVKVQSSGGVKIIAALRDALIVNGVVESFAQMMGLPGTQLSDTYMFPAYNNVTLSEQLRIGVP